jgi:DMSO/TMAO reductase YedYZ molybdopterin-dependent catalytic subunit
MDRRSLRFASERRSHPNLRDTRIDIGRRAILQGGSMLALAAAVGAPVPFARFFPRDLIPVALAAETVDLAALGKHPELVVIGDRPLVAETPPHLLDDDVTPADRLFMRNNGLPPDARSIDPATWTLTVDGESAAKPTTFTIDDLKRRFRTVRRHVWIECAGNGRAGFYPPTRGSAWTYGGVGFPMWTGVLLRDVLQSVGIGDDAVYIGYFAADRHLSGDPRKEPISRGVPIAKAMSDGVLIAWAMNDQDIPIWHGHPLRLVAGGAPASASGKWLERIAVRNKVHDGEKMLPPSYRMPCEPVPPGESGGDMCILELMPVKSLITFPRSGEEHGLAAPLTVRGHAWTGEGRVVRVDLSYDFGQTWIGTDLARPANAFAPQPFSPPQRFSAELRLPGRGYYEIWARATDEAGRSQPMIAPGWNPGGYANNAMHRVAVRVT